MSAQTAPAYKPDVEPVTPVIIKVGGDEDYDVDVPGSPNLVTINSPIPFAETVPGLKWVSSQSTLIGRITNLGIIDGSITTNLPVSPGLDLASVTIKFGRTQLIAMESGVTADVPAHNNVLLLIMSPEVPFSKVGSDRWQESTTIFPQKIESVTLMVGDAKKLFYEFQTEKVTVAITFG